jgi:hypothetical protein
MITMPVSVGLFILERAFAKPKQRCHSQFWGTAFGSEAKASREGAGMVGQRLRSGVDLRLHFAGVWAGANGCWCCEDRRFQDKDEDIESEEAFDHGSQIENGEFNLGYENSSRLSLCGRYTFKIQHSRGGSGQ